MDGVLFTIIGIAIIVLIFEVGKEDEDEREKGEVR